MSRSGEESPLRRTIDAISSDRVDSRLVALIVLVTVFSLGHHIDHLIRGNHVGWPVVPAVTPFTYSLLFYPVIAIGLYLTLTDRVGVRYWVVVTLAGLLLVTATHFGPTATEPPADIVGPYDHGIVGYFALGWLLATVGLLLVAFVYATYLWRTSDDSTR